MLCTAGRQPQPGGRRPPHPVDRQFLKGILGRIHGKRKQGRKRTSQETYKRATVNNPIKRNSARAMNAQSAPIPIASAEIGRVREVVEKSPNASWRSVLRTFSLLLCGFALPTLLTYFPHPLLDEFTACFPCREERPFSSRALMAFTSAAPLARNSPIRSRATCSSSFSPRGSSATRTRLRSSRLRLRRT